jgi:hypothetical protein
MKKPDPEPNAVIPSAVVSALSLIAFVLFGLVSCYGISPS